MRTRTIATLGSVFMLTLAACGGGGGGLYGGGGGGGASGAAVAPVQSASAAPSMGESPSESASTAPSMGESASPSASASSAASAAPGPVMLKIGSSKLGQIIVDGNGRTVYTFTPDEAAGKPTCTGACAQTWPPVTTTDGVTTGTGIPKTWISTVRRPDGTTQVKVKEYTLYLFATDKAPGDTNGQGILGKWFVIGANGETIK